MTGREFWLPVEGHVCATDRRGVVHAAEWVEATPRKRGRRRTVPTVCGRKQARLLVHAAVGPDGEERGVICASWPPPVKAHPRCSDCFQSAGRKRPHPSWRNVTPAEVTT